MKLFASLLMVPALAAAGSRIFDGYDAYYSGLPGALFRLAEAIELASYTALGSDSPRLDWRGAAGGQARSIRVHAGLIVIDKKRRVRVQSANVFPNEVASNGDLDSGSTAYFAPGWVCIENTPATASGTAVRHKAVYLLKLDRNLTPAWKLPSLFASCTGVRLSGGRLRFDKVEYWYVGGQDAPAGVVFKEYAIGKNGGFAPTGASLSASFTEPDNVYRFSMDTR